MIKLIEKEKRSGTICKINKNNLLVILQSDCNVSEPKRGGCGGGCLSCAGKENAKKASIAVVDTSNYKLGQTIQFTHFVPHSGIVGLVVFGIPIMMALLAMILWYIVRPDMIESPLVVLTTVFSFLGGFCILKIMDLCFKRKYPTYLL
ncbi:hypothetical protein QA601_06915 [Chitinispirillales bacterium ANBcel5]|uniref:hypothetical protein n=1 Tax=Cellulosispirillum alkaliphilum TaxID=3039283 RepID=UPI002A592F69|nr:hypothetical protein [Chitinispirillales bacterium ANBcel5]